MKSPILKGKRIVLRPIKLADAPFFVKCFKDPEVVQYMSAPLYRISLKEEQKYLSDVLKSQNEYIFGIYDENKKLIGSTSVRLVSTLNKVAGYGLVIADKNSWGKGYAGECLELVGNFIFKKLKYNRWQLGCFVENKRAFEAYQKAGFILEGRLRQTMKSKVDGKYHDEFMMSVLRDEWLKK